MLQLRRVVIATILAGCGACVPCARASTINFQFDATLATGALAGTQFTGTASYNNQGETGVGTEYFSLSSLNFTVDGESFTAAEIGQGGQVILLNGAFDYFTAAFFPQMGPIDDIAFGFGGPGILGYSTPPGFNYGAGTYSVVATVPEPSTLGFSGLALLSAAVFRLWGAGAGARRGFGGPRVEGLRALASKRAESDSLPFGAWAGRESRGFAGVVKSGGLRFLPQR